ncbi:hypothetical protein M8J75_007694 [Diaphorina citri]|nr:hypothetical protein M8J75_007694 [Diaphorina citri]
MMSSPPSFSSVLTRNIPRSSSNIPKSAAPSAFSSSFSRSGNSKPVNDSLLLPLECAVSLPCFDSISIDKYFIAVGEIVGFQNIIYGGKNGSKIIMHLASQDILNDLVSKNESIQIENQVLPIKKLIDPGLRLDDIKLAAPVPTPASTSPPEETLLPDADDSMGEGDEESHVAQAPPPDTVKSMPPCDTQDIFLPKFALQRSSSSPSLTEENQVAKAAVQTITDDFPALKSPVVPNQPNSKSTKRTLSPESISDKKAKLNEPKSYSKMVFTRGPASSWTTSGSLVNQLKVTHQVSTLQELLHVLVHFMMIQRHEQRIGHNTQRDEQLHKRIKHHERDPLLQFEPGHTAIPHAEDINPLEAGGEDLLPRCGAIFIVVNGICWEVIHRGDCIPPPGHEADGACAGERRRRKR